MARYGSPKQAIVSYSISDIYPYTMLTSPAAK